MIANLIRLAAVVPLLAGGAGALTGAGFLAETAGPATDSHLRYLSGVLLGLGLMALWSAADLSRRWVVFSALCFLVVFGGLARLLGVLLAGPPPLPHLLALVMELGVVPALWLAGRRHFPNGAPRAR